MDDVLGQAMARAAKQHATLGARRESLERDERRVDRELTNLVAAIGARRAGRLEHAATRRHPCGSPHPAAAASRPGDADATRGAGGPCLRISGTANLTAVLGTAVAWVVPPGDPERLCIPWVSRLRAA